MVDWWLDERAHAGDEHLDPDYVAGYERKAGFDPTEDVAVLREHGLGEHSLVIDMGAGTGSFVGAVAPLCRRVIAVDVSPAMTDVLRSRVEREELDNVDVVQAGFLSYEHRGEPADFAYSRNALHQLPDFWKGIALERLVANLRSGGVLRLRDLVFDFEPNEAEERIESWIAGAVEDPARGFTSSDLAEHIRGEHSTYSWLLERIIERVGLTILERQYYGSAYGAYTCIRP